ncbi:MAG TPA: GNAT family N-acetyltransferase [Candidatus Sulfotelmatobacter sp.]|nr:GNAT family N-acetyltransferase [Candidatus Sulfotelmatobacter sp.]
MIETARLLLREPEPGDAQALRDYRVRNAERFDRWDPSLGDQVERHLEWIEYVRGRRYEGRAATFVGFDRAAVDGKPIVTVGLSGFGSDPPAAMVDYTLDAGYEGRGYASEAVRGVLDYAARELGMRQFSATYDPANLRSGALLQRLGFQIVAQTPGLPGMMRAQVLAVLVGEPRVG